jgi:hypothetical protein
MENGRRRRDNGLKMPETLAPGDGKEVLLKEHTTEKDGSKRVGGFVPPGALERRGNDVDDVDKVDVEGVVARSLSYQPSRCWRC